MDQQTQFKLEQLRAKASAGTLTNDEMKEAIKILRQGRTAATAKAKKKGTSKKVVNSEDLLKELDAI